MVELGLFGMADVTLVALICYTRAQRTTTRLGVLGLFGSTLAAGALF